MKNIFKKCIRFLTPIALCGMIFMLMGATWKKLIGIHSLKEANLQTEAAIKELLHDGEEPSEELLKKIAQQSRNYDIDYMLYTSVTKRFKFKFFEGKKPQNEVDLYFSLMSYVQFLTHEANEAAVTIPKDFAFCFEPYVKKDLIPQLEQIPALYVQSKIIARLAMLLYESNEHGIDLKNIMRESVDLPTVAKAGQEKKSIDSVGVLDSGRSTFLRKKSLRSYIFTLDFVAYTGDFRRFINKLQEYNLPVIIRSLEIRPSQQGSSGNMIMATEKVDIALALEWIFVENNKNPLKSEKINRE
jgi:hypothetical protein